MIKIQTYGHGQRVPCGTLLQPRPQGAFPPKPGKSALGTRLTLLKCLFTSLTPEINRYTGDVSQLDIEVNGKSRPSDKGWGGGGGGGGGYPDPEIRGGGLKKFVFIWASFWSKNKGLGPLDPSPGSATGGAMIWNSLPNSFKEIKSLLLFRRKLKCFVQQKYIEST